MRDCKDVRVRQSDLRQAEQDASEKLAEHMKSVVARGMDLESRSQNHVRNNEGTMKRLEENIQTKQAKIDELHHREQQLQDQVVSGEARVKFLETDIEACKSKLLAVECQRDALAETATRDGATSLGPFASLDRQRGSSGESFEPEDLLINILMESPEAFDPAPVPNRPLSQPGPSSSYTPNVGTRRIPQTPKQPPPVTRNKRTQSIPETPEVQESPKRQKTKHYGKVAQTTQSQPSRGLRRTTASARIDARSSIGSPRGATSKKARREYHEY